MKPKKVREKFAIDKVYRDIQDDNHMTDNLTKREKLLLHRKKLKDLNFYIVILFTVNVRQIFHISFFPLTVFCRQFLRFQQKDFPLFLAFL